MTILDASAPPAAARFDGVTKAYGETLALDDVDFDIPIGQTVALLGPNGAGKSTTIDLMLGLLSPGAGMIRTLGLQPRDAVAAGRVGAMLQSTGLPAQARVGELVEFARGLYPYPLPSASIFGRAGLSGLERRTVEHLSGGEAQRVRFALAIAGDPDLLFLDEPTVGMDVETRRAFWSDMRAFAADGRTILFATHYLDEADAIAERILVIVRGRIVADGTGASIKAMVADRTVRFTLRRDAPGALAVIEAMKEVRSIDVVGEHVSVADGRLGRGCPCTRRERPPDPRPRDRGSQSRGCLCRVDSAGPGNGRPDHGRRRASTGGPGSISMTPASSTRLLRATGAYLGFELPRTLRNRRFIVLAIGFPVAFYLLFTRVLTGNAPADPAVQAFGMVSMAAYGAIGASLSAAVRISMERTNGWTRQLRVTPLPALAYVTGKFASAYLTAVPSIALVMLTAYAVNGVTLTPTTWLATFIALSVGALPFAALGVAIGFLFDESSAQLVFSIAFVGLAVLGGLWTPDLVVS